MSDLDQWIRSAELGDFIKAEFFAASWTDHELSATKTGKPVNRYQDLQIMRHFFSLRLSGSDGRQKLLFRLGLGEIHKRSGIIHSSFGQRIDGKRFWINSVRHCLSSFLYLGDPIAVADTWKWSEIAGVLVPIARIFRRLSCQKH